MLKLESINHIKRWKELVLDENLELLIFNHVSNGGSLTGLCQDWEIPYYKMAAWIKDDDKRKRDYEFAVELRGEWYRETVFAQLRDLSTYNIIDAYDDEGETKNLTEVPKDLQRAIASIKKTSRVEKDGSEILTTELKFFDKIKAINLLGKEVGMFHNKIDINVTKTLEDIVSESFQDE